MILKSLPSAVSFFCPCTQTRKHRLDVMDPLVIKNERWLYIERGSPNRFQTTSTRQPDHCIGVIIKLRARRGPNIRTTAGSKRRARSRLRHKACCGKGNFFCYLFFALHVLSEIWIVLSTHTYVCICMYMYAHIHREIKSV